MAETAPQSSTEPLEQAKSEGVATPEHNAQLDAITASTSTPAVTISEPAVSSSPKDELTTETTTQNAAPTSTDEAVIASSSSLPPLKRTQTEALGPATEDPNIIIPSSTSSAVLALILQLTNGARHPYKIDERYLTNRKVEARNADGEFDPREISGYKLKELIWTDWRGEWEPRPTSPSSIRLIYMGKLLDDKKAIKEYNLSLLEPSIVHMTIKPAEFDDEDGAAKTTKSISIRAREPESRDVGCRCVVL